MLNTLRASTLVLLLSLIVSGCSFAPDLSAKKEKDATSASEGTEAANSEEIEGAQEATEYKEQPKFAKLNITSAENRGYSDKAHKIPRAMGGGLWYYTESSKPGYLEHYQTEEHHQKEWLGDVVHIQISDKEYYGYKATPLAIEIINEKNARIVLSLQKNAGDCGSWSTDPCEASKKEPARVFIAVEKDKLKGKKFIIETDTGEKLSTN
ncbi:hypothetical protein IC619_014415 [Hazenella sp. IB182353]|uniref:hypothetical protein n=1 Tax=Polycladospora coralii TaxID=2771432 RepID=UPI0017465586|nr:hypothetical protein [Polycladospora coralii]MBS7531675.1 hypothetical protein [Polycladospora coralii]